MGGVAIYVDRLFNLLCRKYNVELLTYHLSGKNKWLTKMKLLTSIIRTFFYKPDLLYSNMTDRYLMPFLILFNRIRGVRVLQHIHSFRIEEHNLIKRLSMLLSIRVATTVVVPNRSVLDTLKSVYKNWINHGKIFVIPSYLSTKYSSILSAESNRLPHEIDYFLETHSPVIVANAGRIVLIHGKDIYGIKDCIILLEKIRKHFTGAGFIFFLPRIGNYDYYQKLKNLVREKSLDEHFLWVKDANLFLIVLKRSNVFIRPTLSDSYGISTAEALELGIPSIASDVCERAYGTILYKTGYFEDLFMKTISVLENLDHYKEPLKTLKIYDASEKIFRLLESILFR